MILSIWCHLRSLSRNQWLLIVITIFLPGMLFQLLPSLVPGELLELIIIYIVWPLAVVIVVVLTVRDDRSKADQRVDRKLEGLSQDIQQTKESHIRTISHLSGLVDRVNDMDSNMREGFSGLGVHLPPRRISLRGDVTFDAALFSATVSSNDRNKVVRLCRWINRQARRLWKLLVG